MSIRQYVCAFRGRRDNYQVPLALAEQDALDQLITDFYTPEWLRSLENQTAFQGQQKLLSRYHPDLPDSYVKSLVSLTLIEHLRHRLGYDMAKTFAALDPYFSRSAAQRAMATRSHLFLYTPYAWEAFQERYPHDPHRVLFQFHPHPTIEQKILSEDVHRFPFMYQSYQHEVRQHLATPLQIRVADAWKYADLIFCASSFTRDSLIAAGAAPETCWVVPYGVDLPQYSTVQSVDTFQVLFVGSGVQRKGLHHLLLAWQQATLPKDSQLTLVCRVLDPGLEPLIHQLPTVQLIRGCRQNQLYQLYARASLLVMPSLVEGFGQVYLEALSLGCPVLGTANTGLPDLGQDVNGVFRVEPGNIDQLTAQLESLARILPGNTKIRGAAQVCANQFSWSRFRQHLSRVLTNS